MRQPLRTLDDPLAAPFVPRGRHLQWRLKEVIDRVGSAILLGVLAPLFVVVALLVCVTSRGPVFYRRRVFGLNGVPFDAFKFRTMVVDADERLQSDPQLRRLYAVNAKLREDPRLTSVGRWLRRLSIDELPQLINVLRGEMSLVGPRMFAPDELTASDRGLSERTIIKPGMTGLWQVSGRGDLSYEERVRLDREYVERWSLRLDLAILLRTIPAVLTMRGAY